MHKLFQRLVEFTHDAVYRYRIDDGTILAANRGLIKVLDFDGRPEDLVGRRLRDVLVYVETEGSLRHAIEKTGEVHGYEYHFLTLKGDDRWVIHDSFVTTDPDTGERVIEAIAKDITDRKLAELALRRLNEDLEERVRRRTAQIEAVNKELEAFAFCVSHDLRAPLRHIEAFSKLLMDESRERLDETGRDYLNRIRHSTARLSELIDALLSLFRLTRTEMHCGRVDLSAMAGEIAAELQATAPGRRAEICIEPGLVADGDPALLRTMLYNLLENGWKFTVGRPVARIEFGARDEPNGERAFFVRDNGAGFDMAYAGRLFTPFQRLHGATAYPGTGIGLVSAQRIVTRRGGRMWAHGEVNVGATFFFTLRAAVPLAGEGALPCGQGAAGTAP